MPTDRNLLRRCRRTVSWWRAADWATVWQVQLVPYGYYGMQIGSRAVANISNGAIFNDLEWAVTRIYSGLNRYGKQN